MQAKKATLDSARFNVARLEKLQAFKKIYAPFDGVITARNTDVGALIDAGGAAGKGAVPHRRLRTSCASTSTFRRPTRATLCRAWRPS